MEEILRKLISFPTVSGDQVAMHELLDYVADFVIARGMHVEWFESNGFESIVATVKPHHKTPKVMLAAHADVVPAQDENMFSLQHVGDRYLGRGVLDMKLALAGYLKVIDDIKDDIQNYDLGLMVTSDEELGGRDGVAKLVNEGYIPEVCILPDGGDNWQIQTRSKGLWALEITANGKTAHGSRHWQGENAITKLLKTLERIEALFPSSHEQNGDTNTLSLNVMNGGVALNQVPELATMTIDVRTLNSAEHARLYDAIITICRETGTTIKSVSDAAPTKFDLTHPLIAPFAQLITEHTGVEQHGYAANGSSDVRFYVPFGVPCISVYPRGDNLHGDGEWIGDETPEQFRTILREYLQAIAKA